MTGGLILSRTLLTSIIFPTRFPVTKVKRWRELFFAQEQGLQI